MQHSGSLPVSFILDDAVAPGVRRVTSKVAEDFGRVTGTPALLETSQPGAGLGILLNASESPQIIVGTYGDSELLDQLGASGLYDAAALTGKSQVYQIKKIAPNTLVIAGSDRLGTIYGLYALSEHAGVSPLHYWGDVTPVPQEVIDLDNGLETVSREPSVKYRGFFINDEWPCFGNWTFKHFNGFTAEMYDHVFDLLLRLKGNYLWPAMWTSSFALDGPGPLNEQLADEYGITIGASHHEPLLRASEEWDKVRGPETPYGTDWNYITNKQGLLNYWRDGMERSGGLNKLIMMGIRGERDSELLGEDATLKANIDLLKDAISEQRKIIAETDVAQIKNPQMLALYKEVEEYYYGSPEVPGLRAWAELTEEPVDGQPRVTLMFCEDNFGFMRSLPENDAERASAGMYYHLDYHGGPISYEWMPSTSFERIHDQMSLAYDYGIKDVWVVNVGDLKFNEVPLAFFMAMAYDMDKFGNGNPMASPEYTENWVAKTFPAANAETQKDIADILHTYLRMNAARRPEALNENIYHPSHFLEADRILAKVDYIQKLNAKIEQNLNPQTLIGYRSLIGIPARASANLASMQVNGAKNRHFAHQGKPIANVYADFVTQAIAQDNAICQEIATFAQGKWSGHEKEAHVGFRTWNEDGSQYPLRHIVEPVAEARMLVSRADSDKLAYKAYFKPMEFVVDDFEYAGETEVLFEIANGGAEEFEFTITGGENAPWLHLSQTSGVVTAQQPIVLTCDRALLTDARETVNLLIKGTGAQVSLVVHARKAQGETTEGETTQGDTNLPSQTYLPGPGRIVAINANHFAASTPGPGGESWEVVADGGRDGDAVRVFPTTASFGAAADSPRLTYRALLTEPGEYTVEVWQVPTGAVVRGTPLQYHLTVRGGVVPDSAESDLYPAPATMQPEFDGIVTAVAADVDAGNPGEPRWAEPVLDNIRKTATNVTLPAGVAEISIGAVQPNLMLERVLVYPANHPPQVSYLGPLESAKAA